MHSWPLLLLPSCQRSQNKASLYVSLIRDASYSLDVTRGRRGQAGLPASGRRWEGARWAVGSGGGALGPWAGQPLFGAGITSTLPDVGDGEGCGGGTGNLSRLELSHCVYTSCRWQPDSVLYLGLVLCRSFLPLPRWWQHSDKIKIQDGFLPLFQSRWLFASTSSLDARRLCLYPVSKRVCCPSLQRLRPLLRRGEENKGASKALCPSPNSRPLLLHTCISEVVLSNLLPSPQSLCEYPVEACGQKLAVSAISPCF